VTVVDPIVVIPDAGDPEYLRGQVNSDPGNTVTVFSVTVPALTTRQLKELYVVTSAEGRFSLESGGVEIAAGITDNVNRNVLFKFDPPRPIATGTLLELKFDADASPSTACPVTGFLLANDVT